MRYCIFTIWFDRNFIHFDDLLSPVSAHTVTNYGIPYIIVVCGRNAYGKQMKIDWGLGPHSIHSGNHQTPFTFWTSFCLRAHAKWNLIRLTASSKFVVTPYLTFSNPTNLSYVLQSFTLIDKRDLLAAAYARAAWLWLRLIQVARCLCVCVCVGELVRLPGRRRRVMVRRQNPYTTEVLHTYIHIRLTDSLAHLFDGGSHGNGSC